MDRFGKQCIAVIVSVAAVSLTACGGAVHPAASVPGVAVPGAPAKSGSATLRITIPAKTTSPAGARRAPRYISPATQSVAIRFVPAAGAPVTFNQNLTAASNPNCTASLVSPTICTVTMALVAGSYTATFAAYDGLLDVNGNPTGNVLSANQNVPVSIVQAQANAINVTFQGIPTRVVVVPGDTSSLRGSILIGYTLSPCAPGTHSFTVLGVDADGNYILGPGAPVPSLTAADATVVSVAAPSSSAPNVFSFTMQAAVAAGTSVRLTAAVTPSRTTPTDSGSSAVSVPIQLTYQGLCGPITAFSVPAGNSDAHDITAGPDGALWFTEPTVGHKIGRITTAGTVAEYAIPTANSSPLGITVGPDGALWFTENSGNMIGRITTAGTVTEYAIPTPNSGPDGITTGPDGALWFVENLTNNIGRITTSGSVAEYAIPTANSNAREITSGPDGALWFTESNGGKIGRITTAGVPTEYAVPGANSLHGITAGLDGALWFTVFNGNNKIGRITTAGVLTEYAIPTVSAHPYAIASGPDGALWFTEFANKIGRIASDGTITEYAIPGAASQPLGIAAGPDGALWFGEGNAIGRLQ
jgi:virginiamycin B lyase